MPTFELEQSLPRCVVKKEMLEHLENYILQQAADIEGNDYSTTRYHLTIKDSIGTETLGRITDYRHKQFPSDTKSIELIYRASYGSETALAIRLLFSTAHPDGLSMASGAICEIALTGNKAREQAVAIAHELTRNITINKHGHFFQHPSAFLCGVLTILMLLAFIVGVFVLEKIYDAHPTLAINTATGFFLCSLACLSYLTITLRLPYCYFDSVSTDKTLDSLKYHTRTFFFSFLFLGAVKAALTLFFGA